MMYKGGACLFKHLPKLQKNGFAVIKVYKVAKVFYQSIYNKKILI